MSCAFFLVGASAKRWFAGRLDEESALSLAEVGLQESFAAISGGGTGSIGSPGDPVYLGTAVLWVEAISLGDDRTRLVSTAVAGGVRRRAEAVVLHPHGEDPVLVAENSVE